MMMKTEGKGTIVGKLLAFLEHAPAAPIHYAATAASLEEDVRIAQFEGYGSMAQPSASAPSESSTSAPERPIVVSTITKSTYGTATSGLSPMEKENMVPHVLASGALSISQSLSGKSCRPRIGVYTASSPSELAH